MATYEVTAPDGGRYQVDAPDDAPQDEVLKTFHQHLTQQQVAADRERMHVDTGRLAIDPLRAYDLGRNAARGQFWGSYLDESLAKASDIANKVTGGKIGQPYEPAVAYQREMNRQSDEDTGGLGTAERIGGGLAGGAPLAKAALKGGGIISKAVKGGGLGGAYGWLYGTGEAEPEKGESRLEKGWDTLTEPSLLNPILLGAALPPAAEGAGWLGGKIRNAMAPTLARWRAELANPLEKIGIHASAGTPESPGANAAAEQVLADRLLQEGRTVADLRKEFEAADEARTFHTSGAAQSQLAPVDVSPIWQRTAGSAARAAPEAANWAGKFQTARQTGMTPAAGDLPTEMGLPTRPMNARPLTAEQAKTKFGTDFEAGSGNQVPMGMYERVRDALKRALLIKDSEFHGHAANAHRTDEQILTAAKEEAKPLYNAFYRSGHGTDVEARQALQPVVDRWRELAEQEPDAARRSINAMLDATEHAMKPLKLEKEYGPQLLGNEEAPAVPSVAERFDKAKQFAMDAKIDKLFKSNEGRNHYLGGKLTEVKNELIAAIDNIKTGDLGAKYAEARGAFADRMTARKALALGKQAFGEDSEVGVDAFHSLKGENEKLFRLGLLGGYEQRAGRMKRAQDVTQIFQTPRMQQLLGEVIPRTETATGRVKIVGGKEAEFARRPERFGRYVQNEMRTIATRDATLGNSKTAERIADDEAFDVVSHIAERMKEGAKSAAQGDIWITMLNYTKELFKNFGMRQDTAAALTRKLYTTDRRQIEQTLKSIEMRMGKNRYERFKQLLADREGHLVRAGTIGGAQAQNEE